jgi:zinc D-Ala-D-Ala dipeptidase
MSSDPRRWLLPALGSLALAACAGQPAAQTRPRASECATLDSLISVRAVDPTIRTDVRYATSHNFTGRRLPGYDAPLALMRPASARALARVQARLRAEGLGLKVWDAYRPVRGTLAMVEWAERTGNQWVLDQGYVARESGHNHGNTVDLTLVELRSGRELDMGTRFDDFSAAAHTANAEGLVRTNRQRLVSAMAAEGFVNYDQEWWHFRDRGDYPAMDVPIGCFRRRR